MTKQELKQLIYSHHPEDWTKKQCKLLYNYLSVVRDGCYNWNPNKPGKKIAGKMMKAFSDDMEAYAYAENGFGSEYIVFLTDKESTGVQKAWIDFTRASGEFSNEEKLIASMQKDQSFMDLYRTEPLSTRVQRYKDYILMECSDGYLATCDDNLNAVVRRNWWIHEAW